MIKCSLNSIQVEQESEYTFENLLSITVSNYDIKEAYISYNGIERKLPPVQTIGGTPVPVPYAIPCDGNFPFDFKMKIRFFNKVGLALIDYKQVQLCSETHPCTEHKSS